MVKFGQNRVVIVFPQLGIVVKIPIIRVKKVVEKQFRILRTRGWRPMVKTWRYPSSCYATPRRLLFFGLLENWREWRLYWTTRHPVLAPTYFSLFGICNIAKYVPSLSEVSAGKSFSKFFDLTNGESNNDSHHFCEPENFGVFGGHLVFRDYGGSKLEPIIRKYGEAIYYGFTL